MRWTNSRSSSEGESTFLNGSPESCDAIICAHKKCGLLYDAAPFASEFMGTFVLCLTVSLSSGLENFADLAVGASLMVRASPCASVPVLVDAVHLFFHAVFSGGGCCQLLRSIGISSSSRQKS